MYLCVCVCVCVCVLFQLQLSHCLTFFCAHLHSSSCSLPVAITMSRILSLVLALLWAAAIPANCANQLCECEYPLQSCFTPLNETVCGIQWCFLSFSLTELAGIHQAVCGAPEDVTGYDTAISDMLSEHKPTSACYRGLRALYCNIKFPACNQDGTYVQVSTTGDAVGAAI